MAKGPKSNRAAAKRFRVTNTGKVKRKKNHLMHILTTHPRKVKRRYRKEGYVSEADLDNIKTLLPYSF